jgi:hypothetical protein
MNSQAIESAAAYHEAAGEHHTAVAEVLAELLPHTGESLESLAAAVRRSKLTVLEKAEACEHWRRRRAAKEPSAQVAHSGGSPSQGVTRTAKELGITARRVQRYRAIASLTEEAKRAAVAEGLANNQSALLKVSEAAPEWQAARVREIANELAAPPLDSDEVVEAAARKALEKILDMRRQLHRRMREEFSEEARGQLVEQDARIKQVLAELNKV